MKIIKFIASISIFITCNIKSGVKYGSVDLCSSQEQAYFTYGCYNPQRDFVFDIELKGISFISLKH